MKRMIIMLLIACSASITSSANPSAAPQKKPETVIATLNAIIHKYGLDEGQIYSVNRNPNTGIIESSTKVISFRCSANSMKNDNVLKAVAMNFPKDEPLSYQFLHIQPGSNENFELKVITNNGIMSQSYQRIRTNRNQEMWFMCCKNPENPQLRDAYAITWEHMHDQKDQVLGTIYMITSLRPDIYEKTLESSKKTFKIVGRVDENIKDSLYNIYIAKDGEALSRVDDDAYVACVPVINKRFEWQTELDKPCVGRLRCIFPDGELCSAWINLDFVPGETYNITVHNGYYDEDRDFERRVGRNSGRSLLTRRQKLGNDDVVTIDTVAIDNTDDSYQQAHVMTDNKLEQWRESLNQQQKVQFEAKSQVIRTYVDVIQASYERIGSELKGMRDEYRIDGIFDTILKQSKTFDEKIQDFTQFAIKNGMPQEGLPEIYKAALQIYSNQNQKLQDFYNQYGSFTKSARKLQKYLNKQTEKNIDAMAKAVK